MAQSGQIRVFLGPHEFDVLGEPEFDPGGIESETTTASHRVIGGRKKVVPSSLRFETPHTSDVDLEFLRTHKDIQVQWQPDEGSNYVISRAWRTATPKVNAVGGTISIALEGVPAEALS